jgi:hypothetical protein
MCHSCGPLEASLRRVARSHRSPAAVVLINVVGTKNLSKLFIDSDESNDERHLETPKEQQVHDCRQQ